MIFPSCAILEPERPGAEAEPESKEPPWILYVSQGDDCDLGGFAYQVKIGRLAFGATWRGV
jgi:hypothetical protein